MTYDGRNLIAWGLKPGPWFKDAIELANKMHDDGVSEEAISKRIAQDQPIYKTMRSFEAGDKMIPFSVFLEPDSDIEWENYDSVMKSMKEIMRVPVVSGGAVMPDACPAGVIPVGGVVSSSGIHPNYHSADVCCSMAITVLDSEHDPKELLDKIQELTHFGAAKREEFPVDLPDGFTDFFEGNPFLEGLEDVAKFHFTTQGDGNHFYYVGHLEKSGRLAIVSHHGSRGFGARVFKRGKQAAEKYTQTVAPSVPKAHAWLDILTEQGQMYWHALEVVREWTKLNHFMLHQEIVEQIGGTIESQFWNPHNFIFMRNGEFHHAKGATPSYAGYAEDDSGLTLIPMNMAEPILITRHTNNEHSLGFAPHGAGRNMSRTKFLRDNSPSSPEGIDARFWCGKADPSEYPEAYKSAAGVIDAIKEHNLARVIDRVMPYGSIMAGDYLHDAPWKAKARAKRKEKRKVERAEAHAKLMRGEK